MGSRMPLGRNNEMIAKCKMGNGFQLHTGQLIGLHQKIKPLDYFLEILLPHCSFLHHVNAWHLAHLTLGKM